MQTLTEVAVTASTSSAIFSSPVPGPATDHTLVSPASPAIKRGLGSATGGARTPACAGCGGTGYVYLWSISPVGSRVWFCDRSRCKRFWSDGGSIGADVGCGGVVVDELRALVSTADQRVLQPV